MIEKALKHIPQAKKLLRTNLVRYGKGSAVEELDQQARALEAELAEKRDALKMASDNKHSLEQTREKITRPFRFA